jgi:hypothetical protein
MFRSFRLPLISPSAHFAFRSRLDLGKALTLLCLVFLACLLTTRPAHAQSEGDWTVTNQNGDTVSPDNDGSYGLSGTFSGTGTCTYPNDLDSDFQQACMPYSPEPTFSFEENALVLQGQVTNSIHDDEYQYWNGTTNEALNGTVKTNVSGTLVVIFKYAGTGTPPTYLNLLIKDTVVSGAESSSYSHNGYGPLFDSSDVSATFLASDDLGTNVSLVANPLFPYTWGPPVVGSHLVRYPVVNGEVRVSVTGQVSASLVDRVSFAPTGAAFYDENAIWNGEAGADGEIGLFATAQLPDLGTLNATYINKDLPTDSTYQAFPNHGPLYGGSVRFTSDELRLDASDPNPIAGTTYTWYGDGTAGSTPPTGPIWNMVIPPLPGVTTFECDVQVPGQLLPTIKTISAEIGIRTDDTILVGWIDPSGVTVPSGSAALASGVDLPVLAMFPPGAGSGLPGSDPNYPFVPIFTTAAIAALAANDDCIDWETTWPSHPYSQADKDYILNWMFKYAPNPDPTVTLSTLGTLDITNPYLPLPSLDNLDPYLPINTSSDFTCYAGYMDYDKYKAFLNDNHRYKLLNHFQVKYLVDPINPSKFKANSPYILQSAALVGGTVNPTGIPPDLAPVLDPLISLPGIEFYGASELLAAYANKTLFEPQAGPANGNIGEDPNQTLISQSNDGSPEIPAIRAFNTLMALDVQTPLYWQNIGSKITFTCGATGPKLIYENYPTYNWYGNGVLILPTFKQAANPAMHFFANAYPFGEYPSYGLPPQWPGGLPVIIDAPSYPTIPGGRNGIATTPCDGSSPTPAYTVP